MNSATKNLGAKSPSRLDLVRSGKVGDAPRMPKRGKLLVKLKDLVSDPKNERKTLRGIEELSESIKAHGIIEPPTVIEIGEGKYMISTGHRRVEAARLAGKEQIEVIVTDTDAEPKRRVKSLISNIQRDDLSAIEIASALLELREVNPELKTNRDLARAVSKSEQWVGQMLKVKELPVKILKQLEGTSIPNDVVIEISRVQDEEEQKKLAQAAVKGATVREIREKAREVKGTAKRAGKTTKEPQAAVQKFAVSSGWVSVHVKKKTREALVEALQEALKAAKALE